MGRVCTGTPSTPSWTRTLPAIPGRFRTLRWPWTASRKLRWKPSSNSTDAEATGSGPSPSHGQGFLQRSDRVVRVRLAQLVDGVVAARHPDALDAGGVGTLHVARRVSHDDRLLRGDVLTVDQGGPLECDAGDLAPIARVGAVSAEREEPVEPCPMQLDVRCGLDVSGHDPQKVAAVEQPRQHLLDARKDSVGGRGRDRLMHVVQE